MRGSEPERRCVLTGAHGPRAAFIRLALSQDGDVLPDVRAKAPGRGAWIGVDRAALQLAITKGKLKGALSRAFKVPVSVPDDLANRVENALERAALDRLGLEARASTVLTGSERIIDAARKGQLFVLLHAADAASDGSRKLDQAWRVGQDNEGSGQTGLVLAADRAKLSGALGRENVVHIGVVDHRAADRVAHGIDRWHRFIGLPATGWPCVPTPEGSGAPTSKYEDTEGSGLSDD